MMTQGQTRGELLAALAELGQRRPEWRLGQTMANVAMTAGRMDPGGVWELEDEEALAAVRELLGQIQPASAEQGTAADRPRDLAPSTSTPRPA